MVEVDGQSLLPVKGISQGCVLSKLLLPHFWRVDGEFLPGVGEIDLQGLDAVDALLKGLGLVDALLLLYTLQHSQFALARPGARQLLP
jgi:hypothetical protein